MPYRVEITKQAARKLRSLHPQVARRLTEAILKLADDPRPAGCKKLVGRDTWRIRVGDYRVVYTVEDDALKVVVVRMAHRKEVYR